MKEPFKNPWVWALIAAIILLTIRNRQQIASGAQSAGKAIETGVQSVKKAITNLKNAITSEIGILMLKQREGWRDRAYKDVAGKWTIGYGHLILPAEMSKYVGATVTVNGASRGSYVMSKEEGDTLLRRDLSTAEQAVRNYVLVPITQEQFDALVNFVYNVGVGAFKGSTLLRLLNAGDYKGASAQFPLWAKVTKVDANGNAIFDANGKVVKVEHRGLMNRRVEEKALFDSGMIA
jgi:lysozyme